MMWGYVGSCCNTGAGETVLTYATPVYVAQRRPENSVTTSYVNSSLQTTRSSELTETLSTSYVSNSLAQSMARADALTTTYLSNSLRQAMINNRLST